MVKTWHFSSWVASACSGLKQGFSISSQRLKSSNRNESTESEPLGHQEGFRGGSDGEDSPAVQETGIQSLGQEDPLEKGMATYSNILLWRIPWRGAWQAIVHRITKSRTGE